MKKLLGCVIITIALTACGNGETGQREVEMNDNAVQQPTTDQRTNTSIYDSSTTTGVRDSSTTVGHDTSANRKN